jgi:uncharacterized membrane protein YphA (DoxX/SURF4 family)/thiol-disulfide isomerase/thioredoxin
MNTILRNKWILLIFRLVLGAIFLAASISKIVDMNGFVNTVVGYELLPQTLAEIYGWIVPWVELFIGWALILGVFTRISAGVSILLTISFAIASSYALEKSPDSICGCFGSFIPLSHPVSLTIDGIMFLLALAILINKNPVFLTVGQWINRFNPDLKNQRKSSYYIILFGVVVLMMAGTSAVSYGIDLTTSQSSNTTETINIPVPLDEIVGAQLNAGKPVLFYVYAEGCSSCEEIKPTIEAVTGEFSNTVAYIKIDYYQYTTQLTEMGINSTPTIWIINRQNTDGSFSLANRFDSSVESAQLRESLNKAIKSFR